jgi:hypothetical protein
MPLSRQDCLELFRDLEGLLNEYDPRGYEAIFRITETAEDPRRAIVNFLRTMIHYYSERSGGEHGRVLDDLNNYVRQADGQPIRGIAVMLSPDERERFGTSEVDLALLPDRSELLQNLNTLLRDIARESGLPDDLR